MSRPSSRSPKPNVVLPQAADRIRAFVFENRDGSVFSFSDAVELLLDAGYGELFDEDVRLARLLTWVKQVFRRLQKKGWLHSRSNAEWLPTAALRDCSTPDALARMAPVELRKPATPESPGKRVDAHTVDSWPAFIERWVFEHRKAPFYLGELVADMLRTGFGAGSPANRLSEAREVAEHELRNLEREILLERDGESWRPTELLQNWPSA